MSRRHDWASARTPCRHRRRISNQTRAMLPRAAADVSPLVPRRLLFGLVSHRWDHRRLSRDVVSRRQSSNVPQPLRKETRCVPYVARSTRFTALFQTVHLVTRRISTSSSSVRQPHYSPAHPTSPRFAPPQTPCRSEPTSAAPER